MFFLPPFEHVSEKQSASNFEVGTLSAATATVLDIAPPGTTSKSLGQHPSHWDDIQVIGTKGRISSSISCKLAKS